MFEGLRSAKAVSVNTAAKAHILDDLDRTSREMAWEGHVFEGCGRGAAKKEDEL
jgi:hypothetical protein